MSFAAILRECVEGTLIEAGLSYEAAAVYSKRALERVVRKAGAKLDRDGLRFAVYEFRHGGATETEVMAHFHISRSTMFRLIKEELDSRRP